MITQRAFDLCVEHYGKQGSGCGKCPIREACISECRPGEDGLKAWQQRVNAAAESASSAA